jgi:hypothetical protein
MLHFCMPQWCLFFNVLNITNPYLETDHNVSLWRSIQYLQASNVTANKIAQKEGDWSILYKCVMYRSAQIFIAKVCCDEHPVQPLVDATSIPLVTKWYNICNY